MPEVKQPHVEKTSNKKDLNKLVEFKFNFNIKTFFIVAAIIMFGVYIMMAYKEVNKIFPEKSITQIITDIKANKIKKVDVVGDKVIVQYKNEEVATANKEPQSSFSQTLKESGIDPAHVTINVKDTQSGSLIVSFISNVLPMALMIGFLFFIFR